MSTPSETFFMLRETPTEIHFGDMELGLWYRDIDQYSRARICTDIVDEWFGITASLIEVTVSRSRRTGYKTLHLCTNSQRLTYRNNRPSYLPGVTYHSLPQWAKARSGKLYVRIVPCT